MSVPTIDTERLRLRAHTEADVPALFTMLADPPAMLYWSTPPHADDDGARRMIESSRPHDDGGFARFGIERRSDGVLLGSCNLYAIDKGNRRAEIGYLLGRPYWGQGYMHEALAALIDYGIGTLGLHRIEADVHPDNEPSVRALERLGFVREGFLRERWIVGGEISDTVFLGLLEHDWAARTR